MNISAEVLNLLLDDSEEIEALENLRQLNSRKVFKLFLDRPKFGFYHNLVNEYMFDEETRFLKYFHITKHIFDQILACIRNDIETKPCNRHPNPISAEDKLLLTLR